MGRAIAAALLRNMVAGAVLLAGWSGLVCAQSYPTKPIKLILPFAAGGGGDTFARPLAPALSEALGQPVIIENITGAAGVLGLQAAARAAPDGYTIAMLSNSQVINEFTFPDRGYVLMRDFAPITELGSTSFVLVVNPAVKANSIKELIELAKSKPDGLAYSTPGTASIHHLTMEFLKSATGMSLLHVPYRASGQARTDVIGGQVQLMFDVLPAMQGFITAGRVRVLGVADAQRLQILPDVPTIAESGVPGFEASSWLGFMAPAGTPQPIIERLQSEIAKIVKRPDTQAFYKSQAAVPIGNAPAEFRIVLEKELAKWGKVIKDNNLIVR